MPPIEAQFFYSSLIPIDDPLSTSSATGGSDARSSKTLLRPFSRGDNNTLEKAWFGLQSQGDRHDHNDARKGGEQTSTAAKARVEKRALLVQALALKHWEKLRTGFQAQDLPVSAEPSYTFRTDCAYFPELRLNVSEEIDKTFCALAREFDPSLKPDRIIQDIMAIIGRGRQSDPRSSHESHTNQPEESLANAPRAGPVAQPIPDAPAPPASPQRRKSKPEVRSDTVYNKYPIGSLREHEGRPRSSSQVTNRSSRTQTPVGSPAPARAFDDGITGKPFIRVGADGEQSPQLSATVTRHDIPVPLEGLRDEDSDHIEALEPPGIEALKKAEALKSKKYRKESVEVAVGVSRLHMVSLPSLQMKPIYWSPVNDMAVVTRATWFYRLVSLR